MNLLSLMECFVEDLLSYNMIKEGVFKLSPVNFDPCHVLEFIDQTFRAKARSKKVDIEVKYVRYLPNNDSVTYTSELMSSNNVSPLLIDERKCKNLSI